MRMEEKRGDLFPILDKLQDIYFELCTKEKEIVKLREYAAEAVAEFREWLRETRDCLDRRGE